MREAVLQYKLEKEKLLSKQYVLRDNLGRIKPFLNNSLIKVITGPRRAGKSVFSFLLLQKKEFAYINFDDNALSGIKNLDDIIKVLFEVYADFEFILFDEIQNLPNWELFVNKLQRRGLNLVLTGSNANLLSRELSDRLTGRYIAEEVLPFSFNEYLQAQNTTAKEKSFYSPEEKGKLLNHFNNYLSSGGFPEIVVNKIEPRGYLETLFDSILFKDVVKRYKVKYSQKIYDLSVYLISNFSSEFSFTKLRNVLGFRSTMTVEKYFSYLEESYLFFALNRFSPKLKEQIKSPRKIYVVDNGFILAKAFQISSNYGRLMENLVFIELIRRGLKLNQDLFYYKTKNNLEVDFLVKENLNIKSLIQVCYDVENYSVKKREIKALIKAAKELKSNKTALLVITYDYEKEEKVENKTIKFIPLWKWLLQD